MFERTAYCKIHPAVGIARVGNSPDGYFVGPECPGVSGTPVGGFKDNGDPGAGISPRVKRQAARFRIFAYDEADVVLGEVTVEEAEIEWSVHLVNSKAEGDRFAGVAGEELPLGERRPRNAWRNADIDDRGSLIIDPGERRVAGPLREASFDGGRFRDIEVPLGHMRTDERGRLLILGGFGKSASSNPGQTITNYANNERWHDDVSDGPVKARVRLKSGRDVDVRAAWVVVAPPDFAPSVSNVVTLFDVAVDVALRHELGPVPGAPGARPSYTRDIAPIFDRLSKLAWVQDGARGAGTGGSDFDDFDRLAAAPPERRNGIFTRFRNPNLPPDSAEAVKQATSDFVPALSGDSGDAAPGNPANWLSVTKTQYETLAKWRDGNYENDWAGGFPEPPKTISPDGLDRAAYEACAGGAFYPGIEGGWLLRNPQAYEAPFRLSHARLRPGDVTRHMACPWQADFFECQWHWWPAQRPDEVLTTETYRRLREIEDLLADMKPSDPDAEILRNESAKLLKDRSSWTRGMPEEDPEGDLAMIERWSHQGFVMASDQYGGAFRLPDGSPAIVEIDRGRYDGLSWGEYFHILTNIEQHPEFLPKAKEIARKFFAGADYGADSNYGRFEYSPDALDDRLKTIYDAFVDTMNDRSRMDTGLIQWPVVVRYDGDREITKDVTFDVKPFSDRAIKERIRQRAPFNLVDGAWLQRIQAAGPVDEIRSHLFAIWDDEAGNGRAEQNHCNVYDTLLRSVNVYMPPITARKFIEQGLLDSAFVQPVFQLAVSMFPDEFFPELLGMTLYLEWEATPTLTPTVRSFRERGIDPHFYSLHVAIDNITVGHGFMAKEAIKLYLQKVEDEAGKDGVREAWSRIWSGYVTWATAGDLGTDLLELCMVIDRKQIDLAYPAMLRTEHITDSDALASKLRAAASGAGDPLPNYIVGRFVAPIAEAILHSAAGAPLPQALLASIVDELNRLVQDEENFFSTDRFAGVALGQDTQSLLAKTAVGEDLVRLNRLLLRDGFAGMIADIPVLKPIPFPDYKAHYKEAFVALIKSKAYAAKPLHRQVVIGIHNLAEMFDEPERLVEALAGSDLIDIQHPRSSRIFEAMKFSGPMYKIFTEEEKAVILDWIESMQESAGPAKPVPEPSPEEAALKVLALIESNKKVAGNVQRHAQYQVGGKPLKDWFADPRGLMAAFANSSDWVIPGKSGASRLFAEFSTGKMAFMGAGGTIRQWIDTGAAIPPQQPAENLIAFSATALPLREHLSMFLPASDAAVPADVAVAPTKTRIRSGFADRRKLLGMIGTLTRTDVEVLVLGDGPAGSMAALVLARRGRRTLMVDRIREHGAKAGEVLPGIAVAQLRAVGQEALLDSRKHLAVVGGSSSWGHAGIVDRDSHFGPHGNSWHLDRGIFDAELCAAASSRGAAHRAGVRFRRAHELSDGRGWKVELAGLGEVSCSFVVDATGRASSFARSRGVRRRRRDRLVAVTTTAQIASDFEFTIEAAVGGWWYAAALPAGRVVVTYLTDADLIPAGVESRSIFFNDKLDETVHISSRISIQPDARIQVVTAQTESLDAPAGGGWVAVGDAAASFDPLSSLGLTNALETGRLAGLAIDAALAGQEQPIEAYGRYVRQRAQVSDILRSAYYGMETRWPRSPFWDRRRRWVI